MAVSAPSLVRAEDRCDRCGAEALVRVELVASGLPLTFCAHHYSQQAASLVSLAVVTHDERGTLPAAAVAG
jgi:hypothetical protein